MKKFIGWFFLFLTGFSSGELLSQGKLMGQIVNKDGAPVSGVAVFISGSASSQATISNAKGYYVFLAVPEGNYELKASRRGTTPWRQNITISSEQTQRLDIRLGVEPIVASISPSQPVPVESKPKREDKPKERVSAITSSPSKAQDSQPNEAKTSETPASPFTAQQKDESLAIAMKQAEANAKTFAESEFTIAEKEIEVEGGMETIYKKLVYPMAAEKAGIEGKVVVRIAVDREGNVSQVLLISSASPLLNEEVFRVITEEVKFKSAIMDGKPVPSVITIPISFKLR
ncbi:MAG: TonB family protein [Chloroherpetonaceae bacterium]|nr:TonB family protein [Chloroherpetonaceae bacterium]